jgi:hypothetical protein
MQVMMAVLGRPPQNALLGAAQGEKREHELKHPARRIGPMRKVTVIARADGEDAQPVQDDANGDGRPRDAGPDRRDAGEMNQNEREGGRIDDVIRLAVDLDVVGGPVQEPCSALLPLSCRSHLCLTFCHAVARFRCKQCRKEPRAG